MRQWVAHAGLDPRAHQSGTSVDKPARISKVGNAHIRRALYMPALVAVQHNPHVRAFFDKLVARGKTPLQAYVAVMRKLLHAIYGMFTTRTTFVAAKFQRRLDKGESRPCIPVLRTRVALWSRSSPTPHTRGNEPRCVNQALANGEAAGSRSGARRGRR